jgi:hypothetical protein
MAKSPRCIQFLRLSRDATCQLVPRQGVLTPDKQPATCLAVASCDDLLTERDIQLARLENSGAKKP